MAFRAIIAGLIVALTLLFSTQAVAPDLWQPSWAELSPAQQRVLAPLASEWDGLTAFRKKKWLGIAKRYPSMKPAQQARIQRRMQDWVSLTPEERSLARTQFKNLKKAVPDRKEVAIREKWEQYQELPDEEKLRLARKGGMKSASQKGGVAQSAGPKPPEIALQPLPSLPTPFALPQPAGELAKSPLQADGIMSEEPAPDSRDREADPTAQEPPAASSAQ